MKRVITIFTAVLILLELCSSVLVAESTTAYQAGSAVAGWLKTDDRPLSAVLGQQVSSIKTFTDKAGRPIYYIVYLQPSGFVIVSADDLVEPIIGFVERGVYNPSLKNPLGALVTRDLNGRMAAARRLKGSIAMEKALDCKGKWEQLISLAGESGEFVAATAVGLPSVSDPRVDPIVQSKWGQTTCCNSPNLACYNYYTPLSDPCDPCDFLITSPNSSPNPYGDPNNYPCGCVATAMAQLMRFHQHPSLGIGKQKKTIYFNYPPWWEDAWTRGGNGFGGPYNWSLMAYEPNCSTTVAQRQAIGALCYDAGVSVGMTYDANESTAYMSNADWALENSFDYNNVIISNLGPNLPALYIMVNPNLDYNHPVILSLSDDPWDELGHAVVCDGYGYNFSTPYHHLNMGWDGNSNAWYNLPNVRDYNVVTTCIYNVFVASGDEIISGRVTDALGTPISGATVTAQRTGGGTYVATTNSRGIYALAHVPSASAYTVSAAKVGYSFNPKAVNTGTSWDGNSVPGNVWAVNFAPPSAAVVYVDANRPPGGNGSSWASAYKYLQDALADPNAWTIWVADGTYKPDQGGGQTPGNRNASFVLKNGVSIYGGYAGFGAPDPNVQDIELYETILSGDLAGNDGYVSDPCDLLTDPCRVENSYHVVNGSNTNATAILDGFTITAGDANASAWPGNCGAGMFNNSANCTVNKCTFVENSAGDANGGGAGAMWNGGQSSLHASNCIFLRNAGQNGGGAIGNYGCSPTLLNCIFILNKGVSSGSNGGAIYDINSSPAVTNCLFYNNSAVYGGGMSNILGSNPTITNCTLSANLATGSCGGINDYNNANPIVNNCILWNNTAPQISDFCSCTATVNYSDVQGGWFGVGVGDINADPCFVEPMLLDLTAGMISYWKFDEGSGATASDSVNGNNGTISGPTWTTGKVGPALYFHGGGQFFNGDVVTVPHSPSLDITGPFTVEAWIKATGTDTYLMIVDKYYGSATTDSNGFSFYISGGMLRLSIYSASGSGNMVGTSELRDNAWHHVVGLWDGSYGKLYVDGELERQSPWVYPPASTANPLAIGKRPCGWGGYLPFLGTIDEVAIYDRVLSITEIQQHYQNGLAGYGYTDMVEGDYHLLHNSPCIDVGNNSAVPPDTADLDGDSNTAEPTPWDLDGRPRFVDGDCNDTVIVDMGAFEFAYAYIGDFDGDCDVDFVDFAILANYWLQSGPLVDIAPPPAGDGIVDFWDLDVLCENWLAGVE